MIGWMERELKKEELAVVLVSHDRWDVSQTLNIYKGSDRSHLIAGLVGQPQEALHLQVPNMSGASHVTDRKPHARPCIGGCNRIT